MSTVYRLPPCLTFEQFALLTQQHVKTVRRKARARIIRSYQRRIPISELAKYGITPEDASRYLHDHGSHPQIHAA